MNLRLISIFVLVSIAWVVGAVELFDTLTHFTTQWYWFVLASFYTLTLNETFSHRICSHQLFEIDTTSKTYKILTFLLTVDHAWSPLTETCLTHANHHLYSEQGNRDNLNWRRHWYSFCTLSPFLYLYPLPTEYPDKVNFFKKQKKRFKNILDDHWTFFCEEYRIPLTIIYWTVLYFILPIILFKIVLMGRFLMSIYMAMVSIGCHVKLPFSYRNFNTNDTTYNNLILHILSLGMLSSMLHNNHHGRAGEVTHTHRWFEFDTSYYVIKLLRPLLEKSKS